MSFEEMEAMVGGMGGQLRWAASLKAPKPLDLSSVLVVGMGGSGIAGDLVTGLSNRPVAVHKAYGLPAWVAASRPQIVAMSYSGDTEETLSAVAAAGELGLSPVAITGGGRLAALATAGHWPLIEVPPGLQPRAALGYLLGSLLRVLGAGGAVELPVGDLERAADQVEALSWPGGTGWGLARDLAAGLSGRIVAVYGSTGLTAPVAQRWKTQINENAKWPAWASALPELDHNEIMAWTTLSELTRQRVGIVCLRDREEPEAVVARFEHTAAITGRNVGWVGEVWSQGDSRLERLLSLVAMGDLVSLELARAAGVDPVPVDAIERLKKLLAEERG